MAPVNPLEVLKWPGILSEPTEDEEAIKRTVVELFDAALAQLIEMRSSEGAELRKIILEKLADLRSIVGQAATEAPIISARQRDKMISKLNDLKIEADPGRIEQELVIMAQKSDVAEELDRLNTHIEAVSYTHLTLPTILRV